MIDLVGKRPRCPSRPLHLFCLIAVALAAGCSKQQPRVVLYCAQDPEFAEEALGEFTRRTGLSVTPQYDTEANKSISLYEKLVREGRRPRCDVFWNNEILSTIRLDRQGLLEPYDSPSAQPFRARDKAKNHTWCAFADRARVLIVNTKLVPEADRPRSLFDLTQARWKGRAAMAKPEAGTSATQAVCLFEVLGPDRAKEYYRSLRRNKIAIVAGNKDVAEGVSHGQFAIGVTDTDDAAGELEAGRPVAIVFPDADRPKGGRMGTLFIPNTVAIMRGCPNPDGARRLVDYLLSAEVETNLAKSASRQIPLNPEVKVGPQAPIEAAAHAKRMDVDFDKAADLWEEAQTFLRTEFGAP
jgi:iron(III) transport system substrate-binding protein